MLLNRSKVSFADEFNTGKEREVASQCSAGISGRCVAWLCKAATLMEEIERLLKIDDSMAMKRLRIRIAAALRGLMDRIPNEILNDSICTARCGYRVATLMNALYGAEREPGGYWSAGVEADMQFLDRILIEMKKGGYLAAAKSARKIHEDNAASLLSYLSGLKKAYSKIMLVRVDLHTPWSQDTCCATSGLETKQLAALLRYVKYSFPSYLGYAAKFEVGAERGVHIHAIFVFNASLVQRDVTIAKMIGDYWRNEIQEGRAGYFNCNSHTYVKRMKWPAVGCFTDASASFLAGIEHVSDYLAKPDPIVRVALPQITRTLRRSRLTTDQLRRIARRRALAERRMSCPIPETDKSG